MSKASRQRQELAKKRFGGGVSEKPKQTRTVSPKQAKKESDKVRARQAREDVEEARAIAELYDMPCSVDEFS